MVLTQDGKVLPVDARLDDAVDGLEEIVAVRLNVKSDQVGAEQTIHQLALPGANAKGFRIRPRDMPEDGHARIGPLFLDQPGQQRKVIVLDEHDGLGDILDLLEHGGHELAVDVLIVLPVGSPKKRAGVRDMAKRPQPFVGKAVVVALLFLFA